MKLTLGFSPCPNDTFIFDALVNKKIDTEGLDFEVVLADVQTLNDQAKEGKLNITKLSYAVLPLVLQHYKVLNSGGALGQGVGPLLIGNDEWRMMHFEKVEPLVTESIIAIPGENTTAHFLFSMAYPQAKNKVFLRFDEIENFVITKKGVGVIIHENRFTYQQKGLYKITDLGDFWEVQTGNPIPLGGIGIQKNISTAIQQKVDRLIKNSVQYALAKYPQISNYVKQHAQEMEEVVMRQHIDLYVNQYSIALGQNGKNAVLKMLEILGYKWGETMFV